MGKKLFFLLLFSYMSPLLAAQSTDLQKLILRAKVNPGSLNAQELSSALKFFAQKTFGIYINPQKIDLKEWARVVKIENQVKNNENSDLIAFKDLLNSVIKLLNLKTPDLKCFAQAVDSCKKEDLQIPTILRLYQDILISIDKLENIFKLEKVVNIETFKSILYNLENKLGIFKRELSLIKSTKENSEYKSLLNNILDIYTRITEKIKEDFAYPKSLVLNELEAATKSLLSLDLTQNIGANFGDLWRNLIDRTEFFVNTNNSKDFPIIFNKYIKEFQYNLILQINNLSGAITGVSGNSEKHRLEKYRQLYYFIQKSNEQNNKAWWQVKKIITINKGPGEIKDVLSVLINNTSKIIKKIKSDWVAKLGPIPKELNKLFVKVEIVPKAKDLYKQEQELLEYEQEDGEKASQEKSTKHKRK